MRNLENLKKQAKLYLRWHRDGYHPVAAEIRMFLTRFRSLSDDQILEQTFRLGEAQELVARKADFENWEALNKGTQTMPDLAVPDASRPFLAIVEPQLFVSDIEASCDFYRIVLGFETRFIHGEPPYYCQLARDAVRLNLRQVDGPVFDTRLRSEQHLLSATIVLDDVKSLYLEYQERGALFHQTLKAEPWGARTFIVRDPDGNLIAFAG
jgi:catechol 2,3-dioxygenase-like lactoylglutathione lyase family enzyme